MPIETLDDILNELADKIGVYGTCKAAAKNEDCNDSNPYCCRVDFCITMQDRIERAIEVENKLNAV